MLSLTVDDLVAHVRSKIDLEAAEGIDDTLDILPALNRGQKYASDILAKHYPEPLLKRKEIAFVPGTVLYDIPEDAFEDRLLLVEVKYSNRWHELDRISYRDITDWEINDTASQVYPRYYSIEGRKFRLVPRGSSISAIRIWYMRQPEEYVVSQGRVTALDTANNKLTLDAVGSGLSTDSESLAAYVNIVDGITGLIKATVQIQSIDTTTKVITFKSTATRSSVLGRTVSTDISSLTDDDSQTVTLEQDDFLCSVYGTCVPQFKDPMSNFVIEYATAEMKDKLQREGLDLAQSVLDKFEKQVKRTWAKRESSVRIERNNPIWNRWRNLSWRVPK